MTCNNKPSSITSRLSVRRRSGIDHCIRSKVETPGSRFEGAWVWDDTIEPYCQTGVVSMVTVERRRHALAAALTRDHCGGGGEKRRPKKAQKQDEKKRKEAQSEDETSLSPPPPSSAVTRAKRTGVTLSCSELSRAIPTKDE